MGKGARLRRSRAASRAHAAAFIRYFDDYVDQLPEHEREAVYRGELDLAARPDWHPPFPEEFIDEGFAR
jgi:hypothetical protein